MQYNFFFFFFLSPKGAKFVQTSENKNVFGVTTKAAKKNPNSQTQTTLS